jgi:hypothetical protein
MKNTVLMGALLVTVLAATAGRAAEKGTGASTDAAMQACIAAATPGVPHQQLATMAGTWDAVVKSWMAPGTEPMETKGVAEMSMVLGGRYLSQQFRGEMMGQPYEGIGHTGFDNVQKKFVSTWMDNMGTGVMLSTGVEDAATRKVAYTGKYWDPVTGAETSMDQLLTIVDPDHQLFEMYMFGPDGKKFKCMEIHYTRRK